MCPWSHIDTHNPNISKYHRYVKKLREMKTDSNPLLLKIDMSAGHFSASDRYKYLKEKAFIFSFVLDQLGIKE